MNSSTKKILIFSLFTVVISIAGCLFLIYQITAQGEKLKSFVTVLNEQSAQEESFIRISRLVQETEEERTSVAAAFFKDESDSIGFLGEIEKLAATVGLKLTTEELNKVTKDDKTEYITMTFIYSGLEKTVLEFTQLLENIPYHSSLYKLTLHKVDTGTWEGQATIHITIATP